MSKKFINGKSILVTGGTGSFGTKFCETVLKNYNPARLIIFSRDEMKQWEMQANFENDDRVRFFIGDVRDSDRLGIALRGVDYVIHAAAQKILPIAEYNPFECVKTNINGASNIIDQCIRQGVKKVVALSTDKASSPCNLYGATKLVSDRLFIAGNSYSGKSGTIFSVVRYGNVMGSRGSVIPFFYKLGQEGKDIPITDPEMTRFMISLEQGIDLVIKSLNESKGGEIFVKKIPSMNIVDIANTVAPNAKHKIIGIRPGEKLHEEMIAKTDSAQTFEYNDYYKILPSIYNWRSDPKRLKGGKKVKNNFQYASNTNSEWMTSRILTKWLNNNIGKIQ